MANKVTLDHAGMAHVLMVQARDAIDELAQSLADRVDVGSVTEAQVEVRAYTTDRAAAAVSIAHPAGLAIQAKHGALTKAAASLGLQVRAK